MFIWTFFHYRDLGNHLLQLCPKVVKHPVFIVMRILRKPFPVRSAIDAKQLKNVEYYNCLSSMITNDAWCTRGIKSSIASIQQEEGSFTSKQGLNLRKKPIKRYIWSIAFYGAVTWTLRKVDQKYPVGFEIDAVEGWRRSVGPIVWEMRSQGVEEYPTYSKKEKGQLDWSHLV